MKATQFGQRPPQTSTVIEKCSTQGPAAPPTGSRHPSANSEKSDLDSISALRQKNLVHRRPVLFFVHPLQRGGGAMCVDVGGDASLLPRYADIVWRNRPCPSRHWHGWRTSCTAATTWRPPPLHKPSRHWHGVTNESISPTHPSL